MNLSYRLSHTYDGRLHLCTVRFVQLHTVNKSPLKHNCAPLPTPWTMFLSVIFPLDRPRRLMAFIPHFNLH